MRSIICHELPRLILIQNYNKPPGQRDEWIKQKQTKLWKNFKIKFGIHGKTLEQLARGTA